MKRLTFVMMCVAAMFAATSRAQIAYQVSLLNAATGEARANVTVAADVSITDATGKVLYSGSQRATSNNFGVLSLTVGNSETFTNTPPERMPFFISVTIDGVLVGRSQILSVPVADVAKTLQPAISKEDLVGKWRNDGGNLTVSFLANGTMKKTFSDGEEDSGFYEIVGNIVQCYLRDGERNSEHYGERYYYEYHYYCGELWDEHDGDAFLKKL